MGICPKCGKELDYNGYCYECGFRVRIDPPAVSVLKKNLTSPLFISIIALAVTISAIFYIRFVFIKKSSN